MTIGGSPTDLKDRDPPILSDRLVPFISWTYAIAECRKGKLAGAARTRIIVQMNRFYLALSMALLVVVICRSCNNISVIQKMAAAPGLWMLLLKFLVGSYLMSRCIEVAYAFYRDAFAKLGRIPSDSNLSGRQRIGLALASYLELVVDFAVLYSMAPLGDWQDKNVNLPQSVTDVFFYSASSITTSGGGGFIPKGVILQALTAFEIACGLILIVVCFAVYASDAFAAPSNKGDELKARAGP